VPKKILDYDKLVEQNSAISKIVSRAMAENMWQTNQGTIASLGKKWSENQVKNMSLFEKHGALRDHFQGFGANKAIIGIGAGPSFNTNKHVLKELYKFNLMFEVDKQPFIFVAANKMFKPLLELGIHPHFVLVVDAGDALYPQLCDNIPSNAADTFLITGLHTSPRILKKWDRNGGHILFYMIGDDEDKKQFKDTTGRDPEPVYVEQGGNVLNTLWLLALQVFGSTVYMTVGNDLSYKPSKDKKDRELNFYADGDYKVNIANKRDEAKEALNWMGFKLSESALIPGKLLYDLDIVALSRQLWIYKTWMEVQAAIWSEHISYTFYNASESGCLGVLARNLDQKSLYERDNWYLIDELLPTHWHTTTLQKAAAQFLEALWELRKMQDLDASSAMLSPAKMGIVEPIDQLRLKKSVLPGLGITF